MKYQIVRIGQSEFHYQKMDIESIELFCKKNNIDQVEFLRNQIPEYVVLRPEKRQASNELKKEPETEIAKFQS